MTKNDLLFLVYRLHTKLEKITQTKSSNSHPYFMYKYFITLNGLSCSHADAASKIADMKDLEPELKDLTDGYLRYRFEHESEFSK